MTRDELKQAVRDAPKGSRELDAEIGAALRIFPSGSPQWVAKWSGRVEARGTAVVLIHTNGSTGLHWTAAPYSTSLDAAESLWARGVLGQPGSRFLKYEHCHKDGIGWVWQVCACEFVKEDNRYHALTAATRYHAVSHHPDKTLAAVLAILEASDDAGPND